MSSSDMVNVLLYVEYFSSLSFHIHQWYNYHQHIVCADPGIIPSCSSKRDWMCIFFCIFYSVKMFGQFCYFRIILCDDIDLSEFPFFHLCSRLPLSLLKIHVGYQDVGYHFAWWASKWISPYSCDRDIMCVLHLAALSLNFSTWYYIYSLKPIYFLLDIRWVWNNGVDAQLLIPRALICF
jgi:hypothetical protein